MQCLENTTFHGMLDVLSNMENMEILTQIQKDAITCAETYCRNALFLVDNYCTGSVLDACNDLSKLEDKLDGTD